MSTGNGHSNPQSPEQLRSEISRLVGSGLSSLRFLRDITSYPDTDFNLSELYTEELISASLGTTAEERSNDTGKTMNTIYNRRTRLTSTMGAKTLSHAVFLGIASEDIPIRLRDADKPTVEVEDEAAEVVFHISRGKRDKDIAHEMEKTEDEVEELFKEARGALGGVNRPNTVRRACEERVLIVPTLVETSEQFEVLTRVHQSLLVAQPVLEGAVDLAQKPATEASPI